MKDERVEKLKEVVQRAAYMGCQYPSIAVECSKPLGPGSCVSCHAKSILSELTQKSSH